MNRQGLLESDEVKKQIASLIKSAPPVLVEVRFPNAATASDWFLCEEEGELDEIIERLGPGSEVHVSSVWDLTNKKGGVCLKK